MSTKFKPKDPVWVPAARLKYPQAPYAMIEKDVDYVEGRSIVVTHDGDEIKISSKLAHDSNNFGITILRVGDIGTELTLLDPMAKSVLQFSRLLVPDDRTRLLAVRTQVELRSYLASHVTLRSLVILLGHGSPSNFTFVDGVVSPDELADLLNPEGATKPHRTVVSLACQTGAAEFGREFSKAAWCRDYIAPYHVVNGAAASQFCQTLLALHFLEGLGMAAAHKKAAEYVPSGPSFRRWRSGELKASRHSE